jgi:hypothetical protein
LKRVHNRDAHDSFEDGLFQIGRRHALAFLSNADGRNLGIPQEIDTRAFQIIHYNS